MGRQKEKPTDDQLRATYTLLAEGYDKLECPNCNTMCYPDAQCSNGTIIYSRHWCKGPFDLFGLLRRFEIDVNGDLVE